MESSHEMRGAIARRETKLDGVLLFVPSTFADHRGVLCETYSLRNYEALGMRERFVQDLTTWSKRNVLRGPHYDPGMAKFVQVLSGKIYDVVIDVRSHSPTYKQWDGFYLSADDHTQLYIPRGYAHGFLTMSDDAIVHYKMSVQHDARNERQVNWRDPGIGIQWPADGPVLASKKDSEAPFLPD